MASLGTDPVPWIPWQTEHQRWWRRSRSRSRRVSKIGLSSLGRAKSGDQTRAVLMGRALTVLGPAGGFEAGIADRFLVHPRLVLVQL